MAEDQTKADKSGPQGFRAPPASEQDVARATAAGARYGQVETLSPLVRRVLAPNPSPFTYTGTGTYIIGHGSVAIIDPGPDRTEHVEALMAAIAGEQVSHILITHTHRDHSPAARAVAAATGAPVMGCAALALRDDGPRVEEGFDPDYAPDAVLGDGDVVQGQGWTIAAVDTPGHTSNHVCFALEEEAALFSGDHVMGWSTTVIVPPNGNMADYFDSLRKLQDRADVIYYPTHGDPVTSPNRFVRSLISHRRMREGQIVSALEAGPQPIEAMVSRLYANVDPRLHPAAGRSVHAHLIHLMAQGRVQEANGGLWRLSDG